MTARVPLSPALLAGLLTAHLACVNESPPPPAQTIPAPTPPAPSGAPAQGSAADNPRAQYIRSHYTKYEYRIPMRDGVNLFTSVYVPNDAGDDKRYPILLIRTPYSVYPYGADSYANKIGPSENYELDGFIFVAQDVRGKHMSEGEFINMRPQKPSPHAQGDIDESTDTYDTIEWLTKRVPFTNGRVGLWGVSYPGFYASAGAIDSHPALRAVSPQAPIADWWRGDDMHRHGAFNLQLSFEFFSSFDKARPKPTDDEEWKSHEYGTPDAYQFFLDLGPLSELDVTSFKREGGFWRDIVAHPDYDAFWQSRNILPHLRDIKAAVLVVGGLFDTEDLYGPLATYRAIEAQNTRIQCTIAMGPWQHGGWRKGPGDRLGDATFGFATGEPFRAMELAFFKHHLKDSDDPRLPEAMMFETGANRWRRFDAWPPPGTREASLYLRESSGLSFDAPQGSGEAFDEYVSDPSKPVPYTANPLTEKWSADYMAEDQRFAARRPDVLVYQTAPLERDVTLAGPLDAELYVSTTGTDADWVVKLIDVTPGKTPGGAAPSGDARDRGGQQTLVRGEPFRGRYRDSYEAPKPMNPGEVTKVRFRINDVLHTFKRRHRIMIQIQSSWFPFIDRNPQKFIPNIFEAKRDDFIKATHRVHRSGGAASLLRVNILPAADEPGSAAP